MLLKLLKGKVNRIALREGYFNFNPTEIFEQAYVGCSHYGNMLHFFIVISFLTKRKRNVGL